MLGYKRKKENFEIEPQEILLDKLAKERERELGLSQKKLETPIYLPFPSFLFFVFVFLVLVFYLFWLQIIKGKEYFFLSERNRYFFSEIEAARGIIYDKNFLPLTFNKKTFDLVCDKDKLKNAKDKQIETLSQILRISKEEIKEEIEKQEPFFVLKNLEQKKLILFQLNKEKIDFCSIKESFEREYREGEFISHIVGYLGLPTKEDLQRDKTLSPLDKVGKEGVELSFDSFLREKKGKIKVERDATGKILKQEIFSFPQSGKNLLLWMDFELQKKVKEALEKRMKEKGAKGAAGVVLDPKTGGILALVSLPSFDNNIFSKSYSHKEWQEIKEKLSNAFLNRATSGQYLLGSVIKPFIAIAALEEKIINPKEKIDCKGKIEIKNPYFPNQITIKKDWEIHGPSDVEKAIAESCNVFFYTIGGGYQGREGLGPTKIKKYLQLFGFGNLVPADFFIPSWASGFLPDPAWKKKKLNEEWWDGDTYNLAIGQGFVLATPLQLANAFAAIANGGKLMRPMVAKAILNEKKEIIQEFEPQVLRENFIKKENIFYVKEGMRKAVSGEDSPHATAILLNSLPKKVAAKTGTAEAFRKDCSDCYNFWIAVIAPYEDPEIVMVLMLEDVKGYQTQVIVPVAFEILSWYFEKNKN
jgi:penicillin-binding protein 2